MKKTTKAWAAGAVALALTAGVGVSAPAWAADVKGEVSVTLDFTTPDQVGVSVVAVNRSAIPAYGRAIVVSRDLTVSDFGPRLFAPGERWLWTDTLQGYNCSDVPDFAAAAFGFEELGTLPDWTTGPVYAPDPRVTIIGCGTTPTPTPTPTASPTVTPSPTASPTVTPSPTASPTRTPSPTASPTRTPSPTASPTTSPSPTATATATASPTKSATPSPAAVAKPSSPSKGGLANTGMSTESLVPLSLIAAGIVALGAILLVRRRRSI